MRFKKEVKFLSYDLSTLSDGKSVYAKVGFYDSDAKRSYETGFMCSQGTAEMENYLSVLSFGDEFTGQFILRANPDKANTYKLGLVGIG